MIIYYKTSISTLLNICPTINTQNKNAYNECVNYFRVKLFSLCIIFFYTEKLVFFNSQKFFDSFYARLKAQTTCTTNSVSTISRLQLLLCYFVHPQQNEMDPHTSKFVHRFHQFALALIRPNTTGGEDIKKRFTYGF